MVRDSIDPERRLRDIDHREAVRQALQGPAPSRAPALAERRIAA